MKKDVKAQLLDGTMASIKMLLTIPYSIEDTTNVIPKDQSLHSVQIDLKGECTGTILIQGQTGVYSMIGEGMFGMPVTGELLESFIGEFANMLTGNLATLLSNHGLTTDISTPKFLPSVEIDDYETLVTIPIEIIAHGNLSISLFINE
ncbi:chemotaxis protein CheX [Metabacillus litoralis]|uniref:chemotaxis protein CheX n=1 Tax=Metabacillus litoralis TaxID=152268 RepID=UPI001CFE82B3|nr:chemotaxis protein CheX [Metabacillus litoralis]